MSIDVGCVCGRTFKAKDEHAGLRSKCPSCGSILEIPRPSSQPPPLKAEWDVNDLQEGLEEDRVGIQREATLTDIWKALVALQTKLVSPSPSVPGNNDRQREYKVITQKDKWFSGKFDPEKVEGALNSYAKQGWSLRGVATASIPGFGGQREEIIIIMER
jgi:hypothetical protein